MTIARGFDLPTGYVTKTAAIVAKRRIGKTYNASVIAEEFVERGVPFVALDPTSAWWGLRAAADGRRAGLPVTILGGDHGDVPIDVHSGRAIAELVVQEPSFYVLDLGHWESDSEHRRFAAPFLDRLYRLKSKHRDPLHLFVDEADVFAPQKPQKGDEQMLHNMQAIVRRGGIRGLGTTLITQRAAVLNKDVLTQLDLLIILRTIAPQDQDAVDDYIKRGAAGQRDEIMGSLASLKPGEAWIYGPGEEPPIVRRVQFRKRRTFNSSATPDGREAAEPRKLADVDLEKVRKRLAETIEKAKADDPAEQRRLRREAETKLTATMRQLEAASEDGAHAHARIGELERALAAAQGETKVVWPFSDEEFDLAIEAAEGAIVRANEARDAAEQAMRDAANAKTGTENVLKALREWRERRDDGAESIDRLLKVGYGNLASRGRPPAPTPSAPPPPRPRVERDASAVAATNGNLSGPQQRVLDAIAWLNAVGFPEPTKLQVGFIAGYRVGKRVGGTYGNILGQLRSAELIDYPAQGTVALTDEGRAVARMPEIEQTTRGLQEAIFARLAEPERRVLQGIVDEYPNAITKQDAGQRAGYTVGDRVGGTFGNILGRLRSLGLIDYPAPGAVAAEPVLFLE